MNFEPGKWYKTNDERKVVCIGIDPLRPDHPFVFSVTDGGLARFGADGVSLGIRITNCRMDYLQIVGEWKEPLVVEREVVLCRSSSGELLAYDASSCCTTALARATVQFTVEE